MNDKAIQVGDCVALKGVEDSRGVVEYCGDVAGTSGGIWIGVDWDNATRGKHDGSFKGVQYFKARKNTSGSFVRPNVLITGVELISEIKSKYADPLATMTNPSSDDRWEFVQLDKVFDKQKDIFYLKCIVLTNLPISHIDVTTGKKFENCVELDLTGTFVRKWSKLFEILNFFPNLKTLHLNNTRMENFNSTMDLSCYHLPLLTEFSFNNSFLSTETANEITNIFGSIEEIYLAFNSLSTYSPTKNFNQIRKIDLQGNCIPAFSNISILQFFPNLTFLNLSDCGLQHIDFGNEPGFLNLQTLLIQDNPISDWNSVENLSRLPKLKKLMIKGSNLKGSNGLDVRELIIAKMPNLIELDRCDISEVDRRSMELFVLTNLTKEPINPVHFKTIERLKKIYGFNEISNNKLKVENVNSRRLILEFDGKKVQRNLSLMLSIHRIVGMASKIFDFDPDDITSVELRRTVISPEHLKRTKDCLLSQLNLEDGDTIAFLLN